MSGDLFKFGFKWVCSEASDDGPISAENLGNASSSEWTCATGLRYYRNNITPHIQLDKYVNNMIIDIIDILLYSDRNILIHISGNKYRVLKYQYVCEHQHGLYCVQLTQT